MVISYDDHYSMIYQQNPLTNQDLCDKDYETFYRCFLKLNGLYEHWNRFCQMVCYLQDMPNLYFINGLVHWNKSMFDKDLKWNQINNNGFLQELIDTENKSDDYIQQRWNLTQKQLAQIDLSRWVNPFESMKSLQEDTVKSDDLHPGINSHRHYADLIVDYFDHK